MVTKALFGVALLLMGLVAAAPRASAQVSASRSASADSAALQERANFRLMLKAAVRRAIVEAAEAMPADKYGFAPTVGEFNNVRTFSGQVKHLAATNYILAAAALGQPAPLDAGDRLVPTA
jgi:hypothetical protein